jgi:hypothetical protein
MHTAFVVAAATFLTITTITAASTAPIQCACGFSVNSTSDTQHQVFTDFLETDFTRNTIDGWLSQEYNVTAKEARGPYGKQAMPGNVVASSQGLELYARPAIDAEWLMSNGSTVKDRLVPMGEVDTERTDMLYGSFRIRAKLSGVNGTCGAFFWVCLSLSQQLHTLISYSFDAVGILCLRS